MKNLKTFEGKEELINGGWHTVTVKAESLKKAIKMLYVGQKKSYGTVAKIKGRFIAIND